jgi:hypothetical protein
MTFKSTHNLNFLAAPWELSGISQDLNLSRFKIGTCSGLWGSDQHNYHILAINNSQPGNGHLQDVLDWFENSAKRDNKNLKFLEVWNKRFKKHLISKKGFKISGKDDLIKQYQK